MRWYATTQALILAKEPVKPWSEASPSFPATVYRQAPLSQALSACVASSIFAFTGVTGRRHLEAASSPEA